MVETMEVHLSKIGGLDHCIDGRIADEPVAQPIAMSANYRLDWPISVHKYPRPALRFGYTPTNRTLVYLK